MHTVYTAYDEKRAHGDEQQPSVGSGVSERLPLYVAGERVLLHVPLQVFFPLVLLVLEVSKVLVDLPALSWDFFEEQGGCEESEEGEDGDQATYASVQVEDNLAIRHMHIL